MYLLWIMKINVSICVGSVTFYNVHVYHDYITGTVHFISTRHTCT